MSTLDDADSDGALPVWTAFGDLMAGLLGAFVLILVSVLGLQFELTERLQSEIQQRAAQTQRLQTLEQALAGPLAAGRVTLQDGRIGINGSVLFELSSAELQPEGRALLKSLATPLKGYLQARQEILMVSGFTDDRQVRGGSKAFADNWELSAQRALTVTRTLIEEGVPPSAVFAAAFGSEQAVASNADAEGRARNRRVEIAPMPRQADAQRLQTLEQALAGPLAAGRVTLQDGRIGISGNVLFELSSAELQPEGRALLKSLAMPLKGYLQARQEILMVSGFTDDRQVRGGSKAFADNWELSAQRALTVTRTLIEEGVPPSAVFAAAFGSEQAVASNADAEGRARNRRVEIAPMPRRAAAETPRG